MERNRLIIFYNRDLMNRVRSTAEREAIWHRFRCGETKGEIEN